MYGMDAVFRQIDNLSFSEVHVVHVILIGVGRGGAGGGPGPPPNNLRGGANIPFGPPNNPPIFSFNFYVKQEKITNVPN